MIGAASLMLISCGTLMENHYRKMSTTSLQLERYQIMYRVNSAGDTDDIDRKEAIERELTRRGQLDYQSAPQYRIGPYS
jgi:hypothetical protein